MGNLPFSVDSAQLAGIFESTGKVQMVEELDGRALRVNYGPPPPRTEDSSFRDAKGGGGGYDSNNRLFVGDLAWGVDNLAVESLFSEQGKVLEAKVVYVRDNGRWRGFGFVAYDTADEMNNAIESFDGVDLNGRSIRVAAVEPRPRRQF